MSHTRTGGFPIGFRRASSDWQQNLTQFTAWARTHNFSCMELGPDAAAVRHVVAAGIEVAAVDLPEWQDMIHSDPGRRNEAIARNSVFIRQCADHVKNFFLVMLPHEPQRDRKENFDDMVESYTRLMPVLEFHGARIVIEGWPGPGALCCTPETCRAFLETLDSPAAALNYDPSHLIRMGIDPLRFLREFAGHVGHVHGKDTELLTENLYEFGCEQPPTFAQPMRFGAAHWRYTIPGQGQMRWTEALRILQSAGYPGRICIELEDDNFNGSKEKEQEGLLLAQRYLEGC